MSDAPTPRTDKILSECHQRTFDVDVSDLSKMYLHAQHLERESDQLAKQCVVFVEEIAELRLKGCVLNWLLNDHEIRSLSNGITSEDIDQAMKEERNND